MPQLPAEKRKKRKPPAKAPITDALVNNMPWLKRAPSSLRQDAAYYARDSTPSARWADLLAQMAGGLGAMPAGAAVVLNCWSDCSGMASEVTGLKLFVDAINVRYNLQVEVNLVGCCEGQPDAQHFLELNHKPRIISKCMTERRLVSGEALDFNIKTQEWEQIPTGLDVYCCGFPCTPWSMFDPQLRVSIPIRAS